MPRILIAIVLLLVVPRAVPAQSADFTSLEAVAVQELKDRGVPGAAVAIVSNDRVVHAKGFGLGNVETGAPMAPDQLIRLGSTTKMFTAAALVSLADKGLVDLQKPIGTYIKDLHPSIGRLTAHQLLSHTSGMLDEAPMYGSDDEAALMKNVLSWDGNRFFTEPGRIYSYSNPGYWLVGALIEAVGGKRYADELSDTLFKPLGMTHTTLRPTVAMTYPLAQGHDVVDGKPIVVRPFANNAASWPAGSIFSSALDLSRFVIAFLAGGSIDGRQVVPARVVNVLSTPSTKIPGSEASYSYGLNIGDYGGARLISHSGSRSGYGSTIYMVPDRRFGVIMVANRTGASLPRTVQKAMEIGLGLQAPRTNADRRATSLTELEIAAYVGTYSQGRRKAEVIHKDGKLYLKDETDEDELRPAGDHRFSPNVYFSIDADGRVEYLHTGGRAWRKIS